MHSSDSWALLVPFPFIELDQFSHQFSGDWGKHSLLGILSEWMFLKYVARRPSVYLMGSLNKSVNLSEKRVDNTDNEAVEEGQQPNPAPFIIWPQWFFHPLLLAAIPAISVHKLFGGFVFLYEFYLLRFFLQHPCLLSLMKSSSFKTQIKYHFYYMFSFIHSTNIY